MPTCEHCGSETDETYGMIKPGDRWIASKYTLSEADEQWCEACMRDALAVDCNNCGSTVIECVVGTQGGEYCLDCYDSGPVCDDCDTYIEEGSYHLCEPCQARRDVQEGIR